MDQRYVDTMRAFKVILRNLDHLDETITEGQRDEIMRMIYKLHDRLAVFMDEEEDDGTDAGDE